MSVLQMSISAAILILVIVVIRALAIHSLPKKTFVALWVVALFRLLIPLSITLPSGAYAVIDRMMAFFAKSPDTADIPATISLTTRKSIDAIYYLTNPTISDDAAQLSSVTVVWAIGVVACIMFFIVTHLRYRREYKTALPLENDYVNLWLQNQNLMRTVQTRQSDKICAPMTYGLWKPVILFSKSTDWQDEATLQYILAHELTHIKRFDILWKWLFAAALCAHWFNPLVWVMYVLANRDIELSCDETVVRTFGETMKSAYALTLIGLEEMKSSFYSPIGNNFAKTAIKERIKAIMKSKKSTLISIVLAIVLVLSATATVLAVSAAFAHDNNATRADKSDDEFKGLGYSSLSDLTEPLKKIGLTFINVSVLPHTTDYIDWDNPHIGRLSQDEPVRISSKADVDLLLEALRICSEQGTGGMTSEGRIIEDAIKEAGLYDYWMKGIRQITRPAYERTLIDLATNNTMAELAKKGIFIRTGILEDFQALGFYMDYDDEYVKSLPVSEQIRRIDRSNLELVIIDLAPPN